MSGHIDLDDEISEIWRSYNGCFGQNRGPVTLDYSGVRWEHRAVMINAKQISHKIVTEQIDANSKLNEVDQYFKAITNMTSSFKMGTSNYVTQASIDINPTYRLPQRNRNGHLSKDDGDPKKLEFPHIGEVAWEKNIKAPLPSNTTRVSQVSIPFVHAKWSADLRVRTYFSGNVGIKQGYSNDKEDINSWLSAVNIPQVKKDNNGRQFFESYGTIHIDTRCLQN